MCTRGERRKLTFRKAIRNSKTYEVVTGCSAEKDIGDLGRFKKDDNLECKNDYRKTNSEWYGNKNFKHGDKKKYVSQEEQITDYTRISKPNPHEFLYQWD